MGVEFLPSKTAKIYSCSSNIGNCISFHFPSNVQRKSEEVSMKIKAEKHTEIDIPIVHEVIQYEKFDEHPLDPKSKIKSKKRSELFH